MHYMMPHYHGLVCFTWMQKMLNRLSCSIALWNSKTKAKPSGLPDSNFIFFVATKKTKQKKTWRCAGHVWLDNATTSIQTGFQDKMATLPPQDPRLLRASPVVEACKICHVLWLFPCRSQGKVRPFDTGPDPQHRRF